MRYLVLLVAGIVAGWMVSRLVRRGYSRRSSPLPSVAVPYPQEGTQEISGGQPQEAEPPEPAPADAPAAGTEEAGEVQDDLTRILGIGPVYRRRLVDAGIRTYEQLAQTSPDRLREIVSIGGRRNVDTAHWVEQAAALAQ